MLVVGQGIGIFVTNLLRAVLSQEVLVYTLYSVYESVRNRHLGAESTNRPTHRDPPISAHTSWRRLQVSSCASESLATAIQSFRNKYETDRCSSHHQKCFYTENLLCAGHTKMRHMSCKYHILPHYTSIIILIARVTCDPLRDCRPRAKRTRAVHQRRRREKGKATASSGTACPHKSSDTKTGGKIVRGRNGFYLPYTDGEDGCSFALGRKFTRKTLDTELRCGWPLL